MYVPSNQPKYVCRTCRNKIPTDDLEAIYHEELARFLVSPEDVAAHQMAADEALRERLKLVEATEAELKRVEAEEAELFRLHRIGQIASQDFGRYHRPLSERHKQLSTELPRLQAEADVLKIRNLSSEEVVSEARNLWSRWGGMDFNERRSIVETITDRIVVGAEEVEVSLHDLPSRNRGNLATQPLRLAPP
jgi:site-specific DNA recombinase